MASKRSKEEIAKQFDLPERQSKIATIMKQDGQAYCICRSSDSSRFMIGCDACEEWYHGDCINITEKEAKHIKHYYCQICKDEDPTLQTVFRMVPAAGPSFAAASAAPSSAVSTANTAQTATATSSTAKSKDADSRKKKKPATHTKSKDRCGECSGCTRESCGECGACVSRRQGRKHRCFQKICLRQTKTPKKKKEEGRPKQKRVETMEVSLNPALEGLRQCMGPGCRMNARPQSKYCGDDCGLRLAEQRIIQVLPQRIQEWNMSPCIAEEQNRKQLDSIRTRQAAVRATLAALDKRQNELDLLVERAKHCSLDAKACDNVDVEDEMSMYCITCGHEIHSKTAIRHMEKCFNKYESQASFGSKFKTRIEGTSMFCDFFNPNTKVYCKRLRVLCPEHSKDAKVEDTDVCGCPLVRNLFDLTGEFCRAPKKSCFRHYVWEKIRRAEIDLERVRQWVRMDELMDQERQVRATMASRGSVLGLMLHSTYNHELMEKMMPKFPTAGAVSTTQNSAGPSPQRKVN